MKRIAIILGLVATAAVVGVQPAAAGEKSEGSYVRVGSVLFYQGTGAGWETPSRLPGNPERGGATAIAN
jgi:hypothetical protein